MRWRKACIRLYAVFERNNLILSSGTIFIAQVSELGGLFLSGSLLMAECDEHFRSATTSVN